MLQSKGSDFVYVIGITGGVGSGKSRILYDLQHKYGAYIIEADKLAHTLMEPGERIYEKITDFFGRDILSDVEPYNIDRKKLGDIVFNDSESLKALDSITHPLVKEKILEEIKARGADTKILVIEAALLIQDGYKEICNEIWYVHVSRKERIRRLMAQRGYSEEKCMSIFDSQADDEYYIENSDIVIENEKAYEYTIEQINARLNKISTYDTIN